MSRILHIGVRDKFMPPFIELLREAFDFRQHQFYLSKATEVYAFPAYPNVRLGKSGGLNRLRERIWLTWAMHRADKIILHGLFNRRIVRMLFYMPWLLKKCYWAIWGGDLYTYQLGRRDRGWRIEESYRRPVLRRMGHLLTYIPGDVALARQWYGARGQHHECLMYLSNTVSVEALPQAISRSEPPREINILLGNSADPSNDHESLLRALLPYRDQAIRIHVPLSYGNRAHAAKVIAQGQEWFGDRFVALTEFLPGEAYQALLARIDIALFGHQRQQAMGNIITLLGMGKTVFMRDDVSQWAFLTDLGLKLKPLSELTLERLPAADAASNAQRVQEHFSRDRLIEQLHHLFAH